MLWTIEETFRYLAVAWFLLCGGLYPAAAAERPSADDVLDGTLRLWVISYWNRGLRVCERLARAWYFFSWRLASVY